MKYGAIAVKSGTEDYTKVRRGRRFPNGKEDTGFQTRYGTEELLEQ